MGLIKHLLFWPVTGPNFLTRFSLDKVSETVRGELTNDEAVKEDLLALQMRLELGEIDDEEYTAEEAALMMRLRDVRRWREEFGMGTSGGPVRVAADEEPGGAGEEPNLADDEASTAGEEGAGADAAGTTPDQGEESRGIASPEGASVEIDFDREQT